MKNHFKSRGKQSNDGGILNFRVNVINNLGPWENVLTVIVFYLTKGQTGGILISIV